MKDSLGRETDHLTPCDEGVHSKCADTGCDCNCHSPSWQAVQRVPEVLDDLRTPRSYDWQDANEEAAAREVFGTT